MTLGITRAAAISATFAFPTHVLAETWRAALPPVHPAAVTQPISLWRNDFQRSFAPASASYPSESAVSDTSGLGAISSPSSDTLFLELNELAKLGDGWDGEFAARTDPAALSEAQLFVRVAGSLAQHLEATLHVDGAIILELGDGERGSLRFNGNGTISMAFDGIAPATVKFSGMTVPPEIRRVLEA
jgi:hypothetical protein